MKFKKFFFNILHKIGFPFSAFILWIRLSKTKSKFLNYQQDSESFPMEDRFQYVYKMVKSGVFCLNTKIKIVGEKNIPNKPCLFVANHKSNLDVLVMLKTFMQITSSHQINHTCFVSKKELEQDSPKVFYAAKLIDCVFLDRTNLRDALRVINEEKEILKKGQLSITVFIEGTRIKEDKFGDFKAAALEPAYATYCPIVPVVIYGTLNKTNKGKFKYKEVIVEFLPQIKYKEYINLKKDLIAEKIKEKMEKRYFELKENPNIDTDN